jgi:hypothetical protein
MLYEDNVTEAHSTVILHDFLPSVIISMAAIRISEVHLGILCDTSGNARRCSGGSQN